MLDCMAACFEWADAYDTKDWARLARCIAPTLLVDYRSFLNKKWDAMPAPDFLAMASSPAVLGDPTLRTQHFIGASRWHRLADDEIVGFHQLRVPHQRYADAECKTVVVKGHAHSTNKHWYRLVDGVWKFAGLAPDIRWFEYDFDAVFAAGRDALGEDEAAAAKAAVVPAPETVVAGAPAAEHSFPTKTMDRNPAEQPVPADTVALDTVAAAVQVPTTQAPTSAGKTM